MQCVNIMCKCICVFVYLCVRCVQELCKMCSICVQDVRKMCARRAQEAVCKMCAKCAKYVCKMVAWWLSPNIIISILFVRFVECHQQETQHKKEAKKKMALQEEDQ